jgi:hypothetical protein
VVTLAPILSMDDGAVYMQPVLLAFQISLLLPSSWWNKIPWLTTWIFYFVFEIFPAPNLSHDNSHLKWDFLIFLSPSMKILGSYLKIHRKSRPLPSTPFIIQYSISKFLRVSSYISTAYSYVVRYWSVIIEVKESKGIPVISRGCLQRCQMLRVSQMAVKLSALQAGCSLLPKNIVSVSCNHFC